MEIWNDLIKGIARHYLWLYMGWRDVYRRYIRSFLGPSWLIINSLVMVGVMGPLYSFLFHIPMQNYLVYMVTSMLSWQLIAQLFAEMPNIYITNSSYITDVNLPFSVYHLQMLWRNMIIYGNNLLIIVPVIALFGHFDWQAMLMFPINLALVFINAFLFSYLIGALGTRFRDITPIANSIIQIAFFTTPILWKKDMIGQYVSLNYVNPFFNMLEMLRGPFLGYVPDMPSYILLIVLAMIGYGLNVLTYRNIQPRVAYWL